MTLQDKATDAAAERIKAKLAEGTGMVAIVPADVAALCAVVAKPDEIVASLAQGSAPHPRCKPLPVFYVESADVRHLMAAAGYGVPDGDAG